MYINNKQRSKSQEVCGQRWRQDLYLAVDFLKLFITIFIYTNCTQIDDENKV